MNRNWLFIALICIATALAAGAQETSSEVSVVGSGFFTKDSHHSAISQRGSETGGFLVGYRYNFSRWFSAEANYGYLRNTQSFVASAANAAIQSDVHLATGDLVMKLPTFSDRWSPYVLAGGGALIFNPTDAGKAAAPGADLQARAAFLYGGGVDFNVTRHVALRAEYRGYVYQAPNFQLSSLKTDATTHLAQPSAGIVFRF